MNLCVYTLGCRLNQCESEAIADSFSAAGWNIVKEDESADLYIVNTCTVTAKAEQKARRMIRLFARRSEVIVTGCYAAVNPEEVEKLSERVTIFSLKEKASLLELPEHIASKTAEGMPLFIGLQDRLLHNIQRVVAVFHIAVGDAVKPNLIVFDKRGEPLLCHQRQEHPFPILLRR